MRIAILCAVFAPEPLTSAVACQEIAADLARRGHEVTVIAPYPSRPGGRFYEGIRPRLFARERAPEGYDILRVWSRPTGDSPRLRSRIAEAFTVAVTSSVALLGVDADAVIVYSWPLFGNGLGVMMSVVRGLPVAVSVQDIYPEAIAASGKTDPGRFAFRVMRAIDAAVARRATALVVISDGFRRIYECDRGIAPDAIRVIPNWMDGSAIVPGPREGRFRRQLGIGSREFVAMYAGNVGALAGVMTIIDAAAALRDDPGIRFIIAGGGSDLDRCRAAVRERGLTNVAFHHPWVAEPVSEVHAAADVLLLPARRGVAKSSVASKLIAYLLSGRPVIAAVEDDSDTAHVVARSGAGLRVAPEDGQALAQAIAALRRAPDRLAGMGEAARDYAAGRFTREACLPKWSDLVDQLGEERLSGDNVRARKYSWAACFALIATIVVLSTLPSSAPGIAHLSPWPFHALAYAIVSGIILALNGDQRRAYLIAASLPVMGATLELVQTRIPGRGFEWSDLFANFLGVLTATVVYGVVRLAPARAEYPRPDSLVSEPADPAQERLR